MYFMPITLVVFVIILFYITHKSKKKSNKPNIWIHVDREYNSRNWSSFYSRSSFNLNQPYITLCINSIIKHNDKDFTINIIDDSAFKKLIPGWDINLEGVPEPIKYNIRILAFTKILYLHGGVLVPNSFLCFKSLIKLTNSFPFSCEHVSKDDYILKPTELFIGSKKGDNSIRLLMKELERLISTNQSESIKFSGNIENYLENNENLNIISGKLVGTQTQQNTPVLIEDLLSTNYLSFHNDMFGIYIPSKEILKRNKYNWFVRLNREQLLSSEMIISKYMIIASH